MRYRMCDPRSSDQPEARTWEVGLGDGVELGSPAGVTTVERPKARPDHSECSGAPPIQLQTWLECSGSPNPASVQTSG